MIDGFVMTARRVKSAGFDGIETKIELAAKKGFDALVFGLLVGLKILVLSLTPFHRLLLFFKMYALASTSICSRVFTGFCLSQFSSSSRSK